jgi:hypothetical protein
MSSGQTLGQAKYNRTIAGTPPSAGVFRLDTARTRKVRKEKEKKMGWLKRKFAQWCREAWENSHSISEVEPSRDYVTRERHCDERITLRLEKAIGGHIVTVSKYSGRIDRHSENTYLVRDDDNLEEALTAVFIQEKISQ